MDINQFRNYLIGIQKQSVTEATSTSTKSGTIVTRTGQKIFLTKGDVVNITTDNGRTHNGVTLTYVVDGLHDPMGGQLMFKTPGETGEHGSSGNALEKIEKSN